MKDSTSDTIDTVTNTCSLTTAIDKGSPDLELDTTQNNSFTGASNGSTVTRRNIQNANGRRCSFSDATPEGLHYHPHRKPCHIESSSDANQASNRKLATAEPAVTSCRGGYSATILSPCKSIKTRTSILFISILIFACIVCTGIALIDVVAKSNTNSNRVNVQQLAVDTGQFFANELDKATLPLFSLAQFATELDLFNDLPSKIGQAGVNGSLPFINATFDDGFQRRDTTGICDQLDIMEKFDKIAQVATTSAKLGDILQKVQFAPFGVVCLSSPLIYEETKDGNVLNSSNAIGVDLLNTPQLQFAARENLKVESISIVGPRILAQCPDCGLYFIVRIPIISTTNRIEIDGLQYDRWGFATALIQWEKLIQRSNIYETFSRQNKAFRLTRTDHILNATTKEYNEMIVTLAQSEYYDPARSRNEIEHNLQTTNNEWKIVIQYADTNSWSTWAIVICIAVALCISCLTYVTLIQKHNHSIMKSKTLVQEAKVDVERNMTAYFAHELRNPLSAIDCALLSMPDNLTLETKELVVGMKLCSTFMSSIMNNLLDVRKMEEGKLVVRCEPFSLTKLVANIHAMTLPTVKTNVELIQIVETENRDWVLGDIHRLEQIMYNLVSNSIKYTRVGSIAIYAGWDDANNVRLECRDTGPGIPKEEQENLFERFIQRGDAPGSGLGLAIAKKLVTLMGGSIWFDSDPTQRPGTNCIAVLPLRVCEAPMEIVDQSNAPIEEPIRILIVDDISMNRNMLRRRFEKCVAPNCVIQEARTGEESLTVCGEDGTSFDVIIMDQYMNEAGGVMVGTDAIIALRRMNVQSYIIGCSGNDLNERFYTAGANLIWKKPLPSNTEIIQQLRVALSWKKHHEDIDAV